MIQPSKPKTLLLQTFQTAVGKTSILMSLLQRKYQPDFQSTIGVEFSSKVVLIDHQTKVKLQIWDTAGQESFRSIIKTFYRNSHAIMLVYNIANSFLSCQSWLQEAFECSNTDSFKILVGAQSDRESERQVTYQMGQQFKEDNSLDIFMETSAKEFQNIDDLFKEIGKLLFNKHMKDKVLIQRFPDSSVNSSPYQKSNGNSPSKINHSDYSRQLSNGETSNFEVTQNGGNIYYHKLNGYADIQPANLQNLTLARDGKSTDKPKCC